MTDEYISRKAAYKTLTEYYHHTTQTMHDALREALDRVPSADVQQVRHGRWIKTIGENGVTSACRCNLCGFEDNRYSLFNYCPNCGASMMDGEA